MLSPKATILLTSLVVVLMTTRVANAENQPCQDVPTDNTFKMEDVEGTWYPTDIVLHRDDLKINGVPLTSQCPVVTFVVPNRSKKLLTMVWNSTDGELEYKFIQKGSRGQWQSTPEQHGGKYSILSVDKDKYMILRYCSPTVHNSTFLSRQSGGSQQFMGEAKTVLAGILKYPQLERQSSMATDEYKNFGGFIKLIKLDDKYGFITFCSKYNRILSTVAFSRSGEMPRDIYDETLHILDSLDQKRAVEIHINPCGEDEEDSAQLIIASMFLAVLPIVVTWSGL